MLLPLLTGLLVSYVGLQMPSPLERYLDLLAGAAGPAALFAMGMALYGYPLSAGATEVGWLVVLKLLVQPLITWGLVTAAQFGHHRRYHGVVNRYIVDIAERVRHGLA